MNLKELESWIKDEKNAKDEYLTLANQIYDERKGTNPDGNNENKILQAERKALSAMLEKLETTHQEKMAGIKKSYQEGDIKSESEFERKKFSQEQAYYLLSEDSLKKHLKKVTSEEVKSDILNRLSELQNKQLDQQIKYQAELEKIILAANPEAREKQEYEKRLRDLDLFGKTRQDLEKELLTAETEQEKELIQKRMEALELLEKQHQDNLFAIRREAKMRENKQGQEEFENSFADKKSSNEEELSKREQEFTLQKGLGLLSDNEAFNAEVEIHRLRLEMIQEEIDARKEAGLETSKLTKQYLKGEQDLTKLYVREFNRRAKEYTQYGEEIGTVVGNVISGQEDALQAFSDTMIDILFDTITQIINAEIMKVMATGTGAMARATAEQIASGGFAGIAKAAVLTGLIAAAMTVARSALKGLIGKKSSSSSSASGTGERVVNSGFAEGGYTGAGGKYEVKGQLPDGSLYHGDEYIIPKEEFRNPVFAPMIRAIDNSRRQRTHKNPLPDGYAEGGYTGDENTSDSVNTVSQQNFDNMSYTLEKLNFAVTKLMDKGVWVNYYEFESAQKTVEKSRKNASKR